jgi:hypothetical protein
MDDVLECFFEDFAPGPDVRPAPASSIERYRGELPERLLRLWESNGWGGYGDGLFWIVDPEPYAPVVEAWLDGTPFATLDRYHAIARSAFGWLFLWGARTGPSLSIVTPHGMLNAKGDGATLVAANVDVTLSAFLISKQRRLLDQTDARKKPLFERAVKMLGALAADEMYGYEPALVIGGSNDLGNLVRVNAIVHMAILAEFSEKQIWKNMQRLA